MIYLTPLFLWFYVPLGLILFTEGYQGFTRLRKKHFWLILSAIFLVLALARPALEQEPIEVQERGSDVVVAVDLSYSMQAQDIKPTRLEAAKSLLDELVEDGHNNRYGILGYTTNAIILSPMTSDAALLKQLFSGLDENMIMTKGTVLMPALKLARKMSKSKKVIVVLLTDGGDELNYNREAAYAKEEGLIVNVVMLATSGGSTLLNAQEKVMKDELGHIVVSARNSAIEQVADVSGGKVLTTLSGLQSAISAQDGDEFTTETKLMQYNELFYYFAALSLLFALFSFTFLGKRVGKKLVALLLLVGINTQASMLESLYFDMAKDDYKQERYESAAKLFEGIDDPVAQYNSANSLYKAGKYEEALNRYMQIKTADASFKAKLYFNMGNCYIRLQEFIKAREMFVKSLQLQADPQAEENLFFIVKAEEQEHLLTGQQEGKKRAQDANTENQPDSGKKKEGGGSNQKSDADASQGAGGKKMEGDEQVSFSSAKSRLSSKQYELINQRSVHETKPW